MFIVTFVACAFDAKSKTSLPRPMSRRLSLIFYSRSFIVSALTFKSLLHFELVLCMLQDRGPISFFCMWISSFPNTIYWKYYHFSIVYCWCPCCKWPYIHGFLGSLFCSIDFCVLCQYHTVFITIALYYSLRSGSIIFCISEKQV